MDCPRCGSPVMVFPGRWECPWCLDSGDLTPSAGPRVKIALRILCSVDFPGTWTELKNALRALVPQRCEALTEALAKAAAHQISASPSPEDGAVEPSFLRDMRRFFADTPELALPPDTAERVGRGELLFTEVGALSESSFGSFWQALLLALEDAGALPGLTDTDALFRAMAALRLWRRGGPGNDPDAAVVFNRLQQAFHARWETLHPEEE